MIPPTNEAVSGSATYIQEYSVHGRLRLLYRVASYEDEKKWRRHDRIFNFIEEVLARDEM